MLILVEHEILNAHKYKNIKKFSFFQTQICREYYFSCWHFNIYEQEKFHAQLSWAWKKFYNLGPWSCLSLKENEYTSGEASRPFSF